MPRPASPSCTSAVRGYSRPELLGMREAELRARLAAHLGSGYAPMWADTVVLAGLGQRTVSQALAGGVPCKEIWLAAWESLELPARER